MLLSILDIDAALSQVHINILTSTQSNIFYPAATQRLSVACVNYTKIATTSIKTENNIKLQTTKTERKNGMIKSREDSLK